MSLLGPSWGRRAVALVVVVSGALVLAPDSPTRAADDPGRELPPGAAARLAETGAGLRSADVRLTATDQTVEAAAPFAMVGVTWHGAERDVRIRTRHDGRWSGWRDLAVLHDGPRTRPVTGTDLAWVGTADAVRVDVQGPAPGDLTVVLLDPGATPVAAVTPVPDRSAARQKPYLKPRLRSRASWGADPSWRDGRARYNHTIKQVHVHHTVNGNGYRKRDVPGLLRGIYRYHTHNLGWSDVGYNFLVDRFGRTWVGRAGGPRKAVRGAHTLGFNGTSTGVAVLGTFETTTPGRPVLRAIARLAAWKLRQYHRDPRGRVRVTSGGSDRFGAGRRVTLPTIDGHRDTNETACPGARLYARLPEIRRMAAAMTAQAR